MSGISGSLVDAERCDAGGDHIPRDNDEGKASVASRKRSFVDAHEESSTSNQQFTFSAAMVDMLSTEMMTTSNNHHLQRKPQQLHQQSRPIEQSNQQFTFSTAMVDMLSEETTMRPIEQSNQQFTFSTAMVDMLSKSKRRGTKLWSAFEKEVVFSIACSAMVKFLLRPDCAQTKLGNDFFWATAPGKEMVNEILSSVNAELANLTGTIISKQDLVQHE